MRMHAGPSRVVHWQADEQPVVRGLLFELRLLGSLAEGVDLAGAGELAAVA
jgi:hypothetical protein